MMTTRSFWNLLGKFSGIPALLFFAGLCYVFYQTYVGAEGLSRGTIPDRIIFTNLHDDLMGCGRPCPFGIKPGLTTRAEAIGALKNNFTASDMNETKPAISSTAAGDRACARWSWFLKETCVAVEYKNGIVSKFITEDAGSIQFLRYGNPIGTTEISPTTLAIHYISGVTAEVSHSETIRPTSRIIRLVYTDPALIIPMQTWRGWDMSDVEKAMLLFFVCGTVCSLLWFFNHRHAFGKRKVKKKRTALTPELSKRFGEDPPVIL